jgi:ribosomal protein L9
MHEKWWRNMNQKITALNIFLIILFLTLFGVSFNDEILRAIFFFQSITLIIVLVLRIITSNQQANQIERLENRLKTKNKQLQQKKEISSHILYYHSIGVLMVESDFTIVYANKVASDLFKISLEGKQLEMVHKSLFEGIYRHPDNRPVVLINGKKVEVNYIPNRKTIYLNNVDEKETLRQKIYDETPFIGYLELDQIEDTLNALERVDRTELLSDILIIIEEWANTYHFELVSLNEKLMMILGNRKELKASMEQGFQFLKALSELGKEKDLILTISGGIALAGIPFDELSVLADQALDTALSRGGDQIIVNEEGETVKYYGGNPQTSERRTRISARIHAQKLSRNMADVETVLIAPHTHADADALGAALGVYKMAEASNKKAKILLDIRDITMSVERIVDIMIQEGDFKEVFITLQEAKKTFPSNSLLVIVDHHSEGQLMSSELTQIYQRYVIIDHHRKLDDALKNPLFLYLEPYASSATEMVVEMMKVFQPSVPLSPFEATILLSGIIVDTNNFMYRTSSRTYEAAALLRSYGADNFKVKNLLRESVDVIQQKAYYLTLANVYLGRFSIVVIPEENQISRTLLAKIADEQLNINYIEASFTIGKISDTIIGVSARSIDRINVQSMMESMGGGGHLNNAAAQVEGTQLDAVKKQILKLLDATEAEGEKMKVILLKDLKGKGKKDEVIEVASGYANFLINSKSALKANDENMDDLKAKKEQEKQDEIKKLADAKVLKERIDFRAVKLFVKSGENGKLYAKINTKMVADAFKDQHDIELDKRKIQLPAKIDAIGTYKIPVKIHKDVEASFELMVTEE